MKSSIAERFIYTTVKAGRDLEQYYSIEIPVPELHTVYQFRIWEIEYMSLSILINEYSELLNWIRTGDRLVMRFYSHNPANPYQNLYSELIYIDKQRHGRLRGHYLAGIEVMEDQDEMTLSWPYRPMDSNLIPFSMWSTGYAI